MAKISSILIGTLIVGLIAFTVGALMSHFSTEYSVTFDNSTIESYDKINNIKPTIVEMKDKTYGVNKTWVQSIQDITGSFFSSAYDVIVLTKSSVSSVNEIKDTAIESAGAGKTTNYLKIVFGSIIFIVFTFIILRAIIKEDL